MADLQRGLHGTHLVAQRKELYGRNREGKIMVANYNLSGNSFLVDKPKLWSEVEVQVVFNRNTGLHPGGKRFAILSSPQGQIAERRGRLLMVENFFYELRRIAPSEKKGRAPCGSSSDVGGHLDA